MDTKNTKINQFGGSKIILIIVILVILIALGFGAWYFFLKKTVEGGACADSAKCEQGLKCINKICSSGKFGSICAQKGDCQTQFCVSGKCTEGKKGDACESYKTCQEELLCLKDVCSAPPDYSKYFTQIKISKMKMMPPGPNNIPIPTTEFKKTDAIEVDLMVKSAEVKGDFYYEAVNAKTGEVAFSTSKNKQYINGQDMGTGSDLPVPSGVYDLNIYFNSELVYTTQITVSE